MEYAFIPSLENCAITNFAILLWNQPIIRYKVQEHFFRAFISSSNMRQRWQIIVEAVEEMALKIPLSEEDESKLLSIIEPIGLEIQTWMEYHVQNEYLGLKLPNRFFWTSQRRIDNKRTAEAIMTGDRRVELNKKYKLACVYCLDGYIRRAWNLISAERKRYIFGERLPTVLAQQELVSLWTCDVSGNERKMHQKRRYMQQRGYTPYEYALECATLAANKTATKYFFSKLDNRQKEENIKRCMKKVRGSLLSSVKELPEEYYIDVLCFLFSQMDDRDKKAFLMDGAFDFLEHFLSWPRQPLFLETVNLVWDCLPYDAYCLLWFIFQSKFCLDEMDYDYETLFEDFCRQTPSIYKQFMTDKCALEGPFLLSLFNKQNTRMLKLTLRGLSPLQRMQIICNQKDLCERLICTDRLDLFELFVQECISSKDALINFKEEFEEYIEDHLPGGAAESPVWWKAFHVLTKYFHKLE